MASINPKILQALIEKLATKGSVGPTTSAETVLTPAIRLPKSGDIGVGRKGQIHIDLANEMGLFDEFNRIDYSNYEPGFVPPSGTFLDRSQAKRYLDELGALKRHKEVQEETDLLAEDLFAVDISGDTKANKFQETDLLNAILKVLRGQ